MIALLIHQLLGYGFLSYTVNNNSEISYVTSTSQVFFSVPIVETKHFSFTINEGDKANTFSGIVTNKFYRVIGDSVTFHSDGPSYTVYILDLENETCPDFVYSFNLDDYIHISTFYSDGDKPFCAIFYQPGVAYRVYADCNSDSPYSKCSLMSPEKIATGNAIYCTSNTTCDDSLTGGFLLTATPFGNSYINLSTRVITMKGQNANEECAYHISEKYNVSGPIKNRNYNVQFNVICQMGSLNMMLGVALVAILVFILVTGLVIYYFCRPNREVYKSASDKVKRRKRERRQSVHAIHSNLLE